jgi:S1-C subfamily serine protease
VTVITYDLQNDLALLKGDFAPRAVFALSGDQPELLQDIYVAGYPFGNEVSSSIKVTKGIISSLAGIGNNFSNIQIDAALQVGNSGGPILDEMGNIVGVAVSKLDARYMYENFGTIPENTNFGIKANVVRNILDSNGVSSPSPNRSEITRTELGSLITGGTYYVSCMMTLAQIERLRTEKVMFENLD